MPGKRLSREDLARRVALDLPDGSYVNLGIGIPTLVSNYVPSDREIIYHSENGFLGMGSLAEPGHEDPELVNAGKQPVTVVPGACYFHQADSFAMTRGGHIDIAVMGGLQVSEHGDLANWIIKGDRFGSIGGAMDIAVGVKRLFIAMEHVTKDGEPKIVSRCDFPLTARQVVTLIYTDLAVIEVTPQGLLLREVAPGFSVAQIQAQTEPKLRVASDLREIRFES